MSRLTENSPSVSDAINTRFSCRAFLDKPVAVEDVKYIVETAVRAPSGGNLQPWNVHVLQGETRDNLVKLIAEKPMGEGSEYHIYPPELSDPYNSRRYDIEHFFRFGKDKLLMAKHQTPDVKHEEAWWRFVFIAYVQLYLSRTQVLLLPKPCEQEVLLKALLDLYQ